MVRNCLVSYFALGTHYWRIAVAKQVSCPFLAKLFSSLNRRPGTLEMRAWRLSVLWTLAFYWFNLSPAKLSTCLRTPRISQPPGCPAFSRLYRRFLGEFRGVAVLEYYFLFLFIDMLNVLNFLLVRTIFLSNAFALFTRFICEVHLNKFSF